MVQRKSFAGMSCSVAGAMELIGDRWALLIIRDLFFGLTRYDEFQTSLGIPAATLSSRLKHLLDSGIVEKVRYQKRPPRDEYRLTAKGRDLWKVSVALREWGDKWDATGLGAPTVRMIDKDTGRPVNLALVDDTTGQIVPPSRTELVPGPAADAAALKLLSHRKDSSDASED